MERKKRSKCSGWECCYAKKKFRTFGVEMRACGQKLVKFCTHTMTHTHTTAAKLVVRVSIRLGVPIITQRIIQGGQLVDSALTQIRHEDNLSQIISAVFEAEGRAEWQIHLRRHSPAAKWGFRGEACFRVWQAFYC